MLRKVLIAAFIAFLAAPPANAATFIVNFADPLAEAIGNDFASQLKSALGEAAGDPLLYAAAGSSLILSGPATVDFWYLGSESRYSDYFALSTDGIGYLYRGEGAVALSYSRGIDGLDGGYFGDSAKYIGAMTYASGGSFNSGGALQRLIAFRSASPGGITALPGSDGFAIFLPGGAVSGAGYDALYLGFDDEQAHPDNDYDDYVVLARIRPQQQLAALPEPASWAMMLSGFAVVGAAMRRKHARPLQAV